MPILIADIALDDPRRSVVRQLYELHLRKN
jgi:hypothetical protein